MALATEITADVSTAPQPIPALPSVPPQATPPGEYAALPCSLGAARDA